MKSEIQIRREFLKSLIVGLLYPAVLGNILYIILSVSSNLDTHSRNDLFIIKFSFLIITTFFYFFDYLYIYFTHTFKGWMFFLDLFFVGLLFSTYQKIHLSSNADDLQRPPDVFWILVFYFSFFILYWLWDKREKVTTLDADEKKFYRWVVRWEYCSGLLLLVNIVSCMVLPCWIATTATVVLLSAITLAFGIIDFYKYQFWMKSQLSAS